MKPSQQTVSIDYIKPSQVLSSALRVLEKGGWVKGGMATDGGHCSLGAISRALSLSADWSKLYDLYDDPDARAAVGYLYEQLPPGSKLYGFLLNTPEYNDTTRMIAHWNDRPDTTYEDVALTFKKAIHTAEEEER